MKLLIAFTPLANPTYAPLGPAMLAGLVRARIPSCEVKVVDLNISAWEAAAEKVAGGMEALSFMRGGEGDFYDENGYAGHSATIGKIERKLASLGGSARRSLDGGEEEEGYRPLLSSLIDEIETEAPDVIGFSFFSLGQLPWILAIARELKKRGGKRIIIGGASSTAIDHLELLRACPFIDGIVLGEGDEAILALAQDAGLAQVPGLARLADGEPTILPPPRPWQVECSADPDFSDLNLARYLNPSPVLPVLASRGCKWGRCRFCAHNSTYLGGYRAALPDETAAMLGRLKERYGASHFYFADLYLDAPELGALAEAVNARGLRLAFHALGRPTAEHGPELFAKCAKAGLRWISWGVESGAARMLDVAGKGTSADDVEKVLAAAKAAGISNLAMMIFGLPTSDDASMEETFAFLERIYPTIDAMTASAFALFSNAPFGRKPEKWGMTPGELQEEVKIGGLAVHSRRIFFTETGKGGAHRPPRGEMEAAEWARRRRWLGEPPFMEGLPVEHYLLYADRRYSMRIASTGSSLPARQLG